MALPPGVTSADRRDDVVRLLADAPEGLSDGELARALGDGVRPQSVNTLCRRMAADGVVERAGTRPIRTRLLAVPAEAPGDGATANGAATNGAATNGAATNGAHRDGGPVPEGLADGGPPAEEEPAAEPRPEDAVAPEDRAAAEAGPDDTVPEDPDGDDGDAGHAGHAADAAVTDDAPPAAEPVVAEPPPEPVRPAPAARPAPAEARSVRPVRDVAQAWSRTVNVQAAVATWLAGRGATIRSATLDGSAPARDLVARLDGDDLHVEITGWPPDGARTHPTTIAADWFSAAARAAVTRRGAAPHARIVIALPDTRRYRALAAVADPALATARTEFWFVDPSGAVEQTAPAAGNGVR